MLDDALRQPKPFVSKPRRGNLVQKLLRQGVILNETIVRKLKRAFSVRRVIRKPDRDLISAEAC
jgi:hypothetical protein